MQTETKEPDGYTKPFEVHDYADLMYMRVSQNTYIHTNPQNAGRENHEA